jgi:hypothetical protein
MANTRNDDMDRIGNRSTPQGSTTNTPLDRDSMNRGPESRDRDSVSRGSLDSDLESSNRRDELQRTRGTDASRNSGRERDEFSE